ncbi:MAG TPA: HPr family phosphocarrier protein [Euzebya sp.]|nr:HPr family phosphocarrier protein [Euzebya sp.]
MTDISQAGNTARSEEGTVTRTVAVGSHVGLHARPATAIAKAAAGLRTAVLIGRGDRAPADARSLLSILALGAEHGDEVTLTASGEGAEQAVTALAALIASDQDG